MSDSTPDWLAFMGTLDNTEWAPGDGPSQTIKNWLSYVGGKYSNMARYCNAAANEDYFSWCGLTVGYCLANSGMAPVFGSTDVTQFLFATSWLGWGTPVTTPQPGDLVIFDFGGGDHHVTMFAKDNGNGTWACHGGNQSHAVNLMNFPKSTVMGIRRPSPSAQFAAGTLMPGSGGPAVTALQTALVAQGFDTGGIDGDFGPLTSSAVSSFQRGHGLPVTGVADPATLQALGLSATGPAPGAAAAMPRLQAQPPAPGGPAPGPTVTPAAPPPAPPAATTAPPVLSPIDQLLGGQALVGYKTLLGVSGYAAVAIMKTAGGLDPTGHTGQILSVLTIALAVLGVVAKVDRATQSLSSVANKMK